MLIVTRSDSLLHRYQDPLMELHKHLRRVRGSGHLKSESCCPKFCRQPCDISSASSRHTPRSITPRYTSFSLSLSLLLSFFALTLLLTRRLSGKPLHLAMRCKSAGRGTQLVGSRKWEGEGQLRRHLQCQRRCHSPLANRDSTRL